MRGAGPEAEAEVITKAKPVGGLRKAHPVLSKIFLRQRIVTWCEPTAWIVQRFCRLKIAFAPATGDE
jgi:hypothetical protein